MRCTSAWKIPWCYTNYPSCLFLREAIMLLDIFQEFLFLLFLPFFIYFLTTVYLKRPFSSLERDLSLGSNWKFTDTFLTKRSSNTILNLPPLGQIDRFHNPWNLIHKCDGSCDVIKNLHISNLLPWHGHVLK